MQTSFRQMSDEPVDFIAPTGGVVSKRPVIIGGICVIPQTTVAEGEKFAGVVGQIHVFKKATGFTASVGDPAYVDAATDYRIESAGTYVGRFLVDAGSDDTTAKIWLTPEAALSLKDGQEFQFNLRPSNGVAATVVHDWTAPAAGELDSIDLRTNARPSSSSGTVLETVTNLTGTVNMLTPTNIDLKADITNNTTLTPTLSATAANKRFAAGDVIRFAIAANNADVVAGGGISHRVKWHRI